MGFYSSNKLRQKKRASKEMSLELLLKSQQSPQNTNKSNGGRVPAFCLEPGARTSHQTLIRGPQISAGFTWQQSVFNVGVLTIQGSKHHD